MALWKTCLNCGEPTTTSYCDGCRPKTGWERPNRPSQEARGYGTEHARERRRWKKIVEAGNAHCVRCGEPILPKSRFDLDHNDLRDGYLGVSHPSCNHLAAAQKGGKYS